MSLNKTWIVIFIRIRTKLIYHERFSLSICIFQFVSDLSDDDKPPKKKTKKSGLISGQEVYEYTTQPVS